MEIKRKVIIQLELAFDVWSLFFSVARKVISNVKGGVTLTNNDYSKIMNIPVNRSLQLLKEAYSLTDL